MPLPDQVAAQHAPDEPVLPGRGAVADRLQVVVLASGSGTLLQALLDDPEPKPYRISAVGSDRPGAAALTRAERAGVPTFVCSLAGYSDRPSWNDALAEHCAGADLVLLAGFMKLIGPNFLEQFPDRVLNSHPSLLPAFPGMHAPADALAHGVKVSGCTVFVVNDGVDTGEIVAQQAVDVEPTDDVHVLHERIKVAERLLLVQVVRDWATRLPAIRPPTAHPPEQSQPHSRRTDR